MIIADIDNIPWYYTDGDAVVDRDYLLDDSRRIAYLSDNPTNGDIFKAMFSNLTIYENRDNKDYPYVDVIIGEHDSTCYPKDWWNALYKADKEN